MSPPASAKAGANGQIAGIRCLTAASVMRPRLLKTSGEVRTTSAPARWRAASAIAPGTSPTSLTESAWIVRPAPRAAASVAFHCSSFTRGSANTATRLRSGLTSLRNWSCLPLISGMSRTNPVKLPAGRARGPVEGSFEYRDPLDLNKEVGLGEALHDDQRVRGVRRRGGTLLGRGREPGAVG